MFLTLTYSIVKDRIKYPAGTQPAQADEALRAKLDAAFPGKVAFASSTIHARGLNMLLKRHGKLSVKLEKAKYAFFVIICCFFFLLLLPSLHMAIYSNVLFLSIILYVCVSFILHGNFECASACCARARPQCFTYASIHYVNVITMPFICFYFIFTYTLI